MDEDVLRYFMKPLVFHVPFVSFFFAPFHGYRYARILEKLKEKGVSENILEEVSQYLSLEKGLFHTKPEFLSTLEQKKDVFLYVKSYFGLGVSLCFLCLALLFIELFGFTYSVYIFSIVLFFMLISIIAIGKILLYGLGFSLVKKMF
ncbi:MAG: hypothetical protein ACMXYK_03925 [Candidatus Woesearchaeota archaeon]